jgi:hypothetical protein
MYIPERLRQLPLAEWNHLVRGIVEVWNLAETMGVQECLDQHLRQDKDGQLTRLLGCLGGSQVVSFDPPNHRAKDNGSDADEAINAYLRATTDNVFPADQAYRGAQMVRAFLEQMEEFGRSYALSCREMCALAGEALFLYRCTNTEN